MEDSLNFKDLVLSEVELLEKLNIEQPALDRLRREKDFPYIRLNSKCRVYLAAEVLDWLNQYKKML
jgi:predicted DNA-binding transcriptional regulator AlpA